MSWYWDIEQTHKIWVESVGLNTAGIAVATMEEKWNTQQFHKALILLTYPPGYQGTYCSHILEIIGDKFSMILNVLFPIT